MVSFQAHKTAFSQERKRDTWIHRRVDNLKDVANYMNMIKNNKELEQGKHFFLPPGLAAFTPLILKVMEFP